MTNITFIVKIFVSSTVYMRRICLLAVLGIGVYVNQPANASLSLGANVNVVGWDGAVGNKHYTSDRKALQYGVNVKVKFDRLYAGIDYSVAHYHFTGNDRPGDATINPDSSVRRTEYNAILGYYVFQYLSFFTKFKNVVFDNGETYRLTNPGVGAQLHYVLSSNWLLFYNAARFSGEFSINGRGAGDTDVTEYSLGVAYRPVLHSYFNISYRKQQLDYQYTNADMEIHTLSGLFISYNYVF